MFRLPNINHPTDSGKIQQIADFLFQFIRQLNMEQNSAEGTVNASPTTNEAIQPIDYVVEQGKSGIWTYRKWASGIAECWGEYTNPEALYDIQWGSLYVTTINNTRIDYPFTFKSRPREYATLFGGTYSVMLYAQSMGKGINTTTQTGMYCGARTNLTDTPSSATLEFYIQGRWK